MNEQEPVGREVAKVAGVMAMHLLAVIVGFLLMVVGLGMGVSVVMLPFGVPLGLCGLLLFGWGMFGWANQDRTLPPNPR